MFPTGNSRNEKTINCVSCGKVIAKGHIELGSIEIVCKCGVKTRIEAENKPEGRLSPPSTGVTKLNGTYNCAVNH